MEIDSVAAIVTGGASGLGEATARALASRGARVLVADLQDERGTGVAEHIGGAYAHTDVSSEEDVTAAVEQAAALGPLRILVNCAGVGLPRRTIGRDGDYSSAHPLDWFTKVITVNLVGTFNCIRLAATAISRTPPLAEGQRGVIVNTASVAAFEGQIGQAAYAASKGGIVGLTMPVARDLAVVGIRVNTIAPGLFDTPIYGQGEASEAFKAKLGSDLLFPGRFGTSPEFAAMVLACVDNDYLNGETIRLDGGARLRPSS
ncbi:MAG: SDR family NAD(P)-dependent oxidoreductase [Mycobacteriales bacterium]